MSLRPNVFGWSFHWFPNPMKKNVIELVSPLPPEECTTRLQAAIDRDGPLRGRGLKPVVGRVSGRSVCLRKQITYRNSFQTYLTGTLEPQGEGTVFRGRTGLEFGTIAFLFMVFGGVVFCWGPAFVARLFRGSVGLIVPPLLLVLVVAMLGLGRYRARDEGRFLIAFVVEVLEARPTVQA